MKHLYRGKASRKPKTVDSVLFQATKAVAKTTKAVKGLLIAKNVRKLKALQDENSSNAKIQSDINDVEEKLKALKDLDHVAAAQEFVSHSLLTPAGNNASTINTSSNGMHSVIQSHPKLVETFQEWKLKLKSVIREVAIAKVKEKNETEKAARLAEAAKSSGTSSGVKRSFDKVKRMIKLLLLSFKFLACCVQCSS